MIVFVAIFGFDSSSIVVELEHLYIPEKYMPGPLRSIEFGCKAEKADDTLLIISKISEAVKIFRFRGRKVQTTPDLKTSS